MKYFLNSTADYHRNELTSLGWELTVCNALEPDDSLCHKALKSSLTFGQHLYRFLSEFFPMADVKNALEIGGGMGYLMRDFLSLNPRLCAKMIDISPYLLQKQKDTLKSLEVDFELADILTVPQQELSCYDLAVLNENPGDMPTLVAMAEDQAGDQNIPNENIHHHIQRLSHFSHQYDLPLDNDKNINIGAMEIVEKLCLAGIQYIYLSEHSCEATVPDEMKPYLAFQSAGYPEMISLKGHQEYTVKFSYLQKIAKMLNYKTNRGAFADFLTLQMNDKTKTALRMVTPMNDEQEIIRQFVYDLYKYEYLILIKGDTK